MEQGTNPRPKTPKPKHPGISSELPERRLDSNKKFTFEPKLKNFVREEIEKEFKKILDSRGIL